MKKRLAQKLTLSRETVTALEPRRLAGSGGGSFLDTDVFFDCVSGRPECLPPPASRPPCLG